MMINGGSIMGGNLKPQLVMNDNLTNEKQL